MDYLSSLGKTQIAAVQRDADIGVAEAERDAGIRVSLETCQAFPGAASSPPAARPGALLSVPSLQEAECKKEMLDVKFMADTKIADSKRAFELQKAAFTEEVNIKVRVSHSPLLFPGGSVMVLVALGLVSFLLLYLLGELKVQNPGLCVTVSSLQQIPLLFAAIPWDLEKRKGWGGLNLELVGLKCCGKSSPEDWHVTPGKRFKSRSRVWFRGPYVSAQGLMAQTPPLLSSPLPRVQTAEAQLAYELQSAREQQKIRQEEIEIEVVERKKQIEVEQKEVVRMEKELVATVKQPAEAEAYRIQQIAEGEK